MGLLFRSSFLIQEIDPSGTLFWGSGSAPKETSDMNQQDKQRRRAVRRIFVDTDPADLGFGGVSFPEYEYDTEADLAMSWPVNGVSPTDVAAPGGTLHSS